MFCSDLPIIFSRVYTLCWEALGCKYNFRTRFLNQKYHKQVYTFHKHTAMVSLINVSLASGVIIRTATHSFDTIKDRMHINTHHHYQIEFIAKKMSIGLGKKANLQRIITIYSLNISDRFIYFLHGPVTNRIYFYILGAFCTKTFRWKLWAFVYESDMWKI